jgi:hypothetical protein
MKKILRGLHNDMKNQDRGVVLELCGWAQKAAKQAQVHWLGTLWAQHVEWAHNIWFGQLGPSKLPRPVTFLTH